MGGIILNNVYNNVTAIIANSLYSICDWKLNVLRLRKALRDPHLYVGYCLDQKFEFREWRFLAPWLLTGAQTEKNSRPVCCE